MIFHPNFPMNNKEIKTEYSRRGKALFGDCIAATIEVEILFAGFAAKRLERIACVPPYCSIHFFSKNTLR